MKVAFPRLGPKAVFIILLLVIYAAMRLPLIGRDLVFEEPLWLRGGISLVTDGDFNIYYGEMDPNFSAFHKPPMISVLLGAIYAVFGGASNSALHIMPFVMGVANFLLFIFCIKEINGSVFKGAALYLLLPYLLVCGYYIQIDPTVGLFGYLLLLLGSMRWIAGRRHAMRLLVIAGAWLAFSKTEICVIGGMALGLGMLPYIRKTPALLYGALAYAGGALFGFVCVALFSLVISGSLVGFEHIYETIFQVLRGIPISRSADIQTRLEGSFESVLGPFKAFHLEWVLGAGILIWLFGLILSATPSRQLIALAPFALVPLAIYTIGGYVGGSFPRTMVIAIVPLVIATSIKTSGGWRPAVSWLATASVILVNAPLLIDVYKTPMSWMEFKGMRGFRDASVYLQKTLPRGTQILANDIVGYYYGGPYYDFAMIESYPDRLDKLVHSDISNKLGAWVYFSDGTEYPRTARMGELYQKLKDHCQVVDTKHLGTLNIALLAPPKC